MKNNLWELISSWDTLAQTVLKSAYTNRTHIRPKLVNPEWPFIQIESLYQ